VRGAHFPSPYFQALIRFGEDDRPKRRQPLIPST
jgi:hypothetical protein